MVLAVDELTLGLLVLAVVLTFAIGIRSTRSTPDAPPTRIANQAEPSRTRLEGETAVYRSREARNGLVRTAYDDVKTLYDAFQHGLRLSRDRPCLGTRVNMGPYVWKTYGEVQTMVDELGSGLQALGVPPGQDSMVGIYSINRMEWIVTDQACNAYSMVSVALYDTLGVPAVRHIMQQTAMPVVVVAGDKLATVLEVAPDCPDLRFIVCLDEDVITPKNVQRAEHMGKRLLSFHDVLVKHGRPNIRPHVPPKPSDLTTICYTSGTTGTPKGVMITHANLVANNAAVVASFPPHIMPTEEDVHISYLPLAHMLERLITTFVFSTGARIGFFSGDVKTLFDDIGALRPTYFISVPRLWNRLYDRVQESVAASGAIRRAIFRMAYNAKAKMLRKGILRNNTVWDKLVFDQIRLRLGGRVKAMISGAAPLSAEVMEFLRVVFGVQTFEGYGQSEACACISVTIAYDYSVGHVGPPLGCVELKLVDIPDMSYFATDKPNPRGEVCVRGPSVSPGYYKDPERTKEILDENGWLHTGDIGEILPNGTLRIIDRKKNIFKLSQGEYISPEKIEAVCCASTFVAQTWVYGDSLQSSIVAVVVPDASTLQTWAKENGRPSLALEELCRDAAIVRMIHEDIVKTARSRQLASFEIPRVVHLEPEPFSVENDLLTPTFKLKRNEARDRYRPHIGRLYQQLAKRA